MTGGRCPRRKMMGRGPAGGCGPHDKPRPRLLPTSSPATSAAVDLLSQALKSLSDRSPFEEPDPSLPHKPTSLPSNLAALLSHRSSDGRRKHKKSHHQSEHPSSAPPKPPPPSTVWDSTADFFRPLVPADMDLLSHSFPPLSLLSVPVLGPKAPLLAPTEPEPVPKQEEQVTEVAAENDTTLPAADEVENESTSMSWLLGCKSRFLLTSERPNKKRRLLGREAGLDKLLHLPYSEAPYPFCDICCLGTSGNSTDQFLSCSACKVMVHKWCYGAREVATTEGWLCVWCMTARKDARQCLLCPREGGAVKPVLMDAVRRGSGGDAVQFAHLFCTMWTPEVYVEDIRGMEPVMNVGGVHETRRKLVCYLCKVKHGVCVRCSHGTCRTSFHPICARESKHQMEIWGKFGCDNVELRAFCSKHSSCRDINSIKQSEKLTANAADISSVAKPPPVLLPVNKLPKIRLSRSSRNKGMTDGETTSSETVVKSENTLDQDCEEQFVKDLDTYGVFGSGNDITNSPNLASFLRKLIDRGKVSIDDVASEMGISSNSLEAALLGETTSFSPGLTLKLMGWLQDSTHMLRIRSGSAMPSANGDANPDSTNAAKVTDPFVNVKLAGLDSPDAVVHKSLPPRRKSKNNIRILKDKKTTCSSVVTVIQQNGNVKLVDVNGETAVVVPRDVKGEADAKNSSLHNQGACTEGPEFSEMVLEGNGQPMDSNPSLVRVPELKGDSVESESIDLSEARQQPSMTENVSSFESGIYQVDEANITAPHFLGKDCCVNPESDLDVVISSGQDGFIIGESCSRYVHPFIQRRLMQVQGHTIPKQHHVEAHSTGDSEKTLHSGEVDAVVSVNCDKRHHHSSCTSKSHTLDMAKVDQLAKAKNSGVLELSPEDEVEEEILYLQTRLIDKAVAIKHSCEDLLFKVVQNLPQELDAFNKRSWDLVHVSQYLSEVREAKKRGRKERKHKEAQAVLAAAVAAASPRNSSLRKDVNDDKISTHQESPLMVGVSSGRARLSSPLAPQVKESSRTATVKVSPDKLSGIFRLPDFPQENALSCDICWRAETMLNRIFVCSCCKVAVHLDCYRRLKNPIVSWKCELCEEKTKNETIDGSERDFMDAHCALCGGAAGAFRKSVEGQWVHAFCSEWLLDSRYKRGQQNPVEGMDTLSKEKDLQSCCICHCNIGVCLKCSYGNCQLAFHPSCARSSGMYMNVKSVAGKLQHKAYCEKHSLEQREADSQQHGAEELKTVKRLRVELEKVRLLCERIIKREKLKRDLVLCSHEVLASRRDYVAFSVLVCSSFFPPGVSSESATTSINNRSYSGTIQRSDDITVDSTASGEHTTRPSLNIDADRKTDDSSTSQLSFKRKLSKFSDRASFAGKQLSNRPASVSLWNLTEDGEKRSKARKHTETFQKELVMTSNQASMQNQRLPKGFAYVPVGCLPKEKPVNHDLDSCEPQEPGG